MPNAVTTYTRAQWPEQYQRVGANAFERGNRLTFAAAELVSRQPDCPIVTEAGMSPRSTRQGLVFSVFCDGDTMPRFVSESELDPNYPDPRKATVNSAQP